MEDGRWKLKSGMKVDSNNYIIHAKGGKIKRNKKKGLNFYHLAAKRGNINAAYTLSCIYETKEDYDIKKKKYYLKQLYNL